MYESLWSGGRTGLIPELVISGPWANWQLHPKYVAVSWRKLWTVRGRLGASNRTGSCGCEVGVHQQLSTAWYCSPTVPLPIAKARPGEGKGGSPKSQEVFSGQTTQQDIPNHWCCLQNRRLIFLRELSCQSLFPFSISSLFLN